MRSYCFIKLRCLVGYDFWIGLMERRNSVSSIFFFIVFFLGWFFFLVFIVGIFDSIVRSLGFFILVARCCRGRLGKFRIFGV